MAKLNVNGNVRDFEAEPDTPLLWVKEGEALWQRPAVANQKSCSNCHTPASYPAFDDLLKRPITLSQRINQCRQKHQ